MTTELMRTVGTFIGVFLILVLWRKEHWVLRVVFILTISVRIWLTGSWWYYWTIGDILEFGTRPEEWFGPIAECFVYLCIVTKIWPFPFFLLYFLYTVAEILVLIAAHFV